MTLCLTPEELISLTGYRRASDQCRFLVAAGVLYRLNKSGKPVVARANAERYLGVHSAPADAAENEPNWNVLRLMGAPRPRRAA